MSINRLQELHDLAKQESRKYVGKRFLFPQLVRDTEKHFMGIVGARGAGKTILLRQYALLHEDAFYLSAATQRPAAVQGGANRAQNRVHAQPCA